MMMRFPRSSKDRCASWCWCFEHVPEVTHDLLVNFGRLGGIIVTASLVPLWLACPSPPLNPHNETLSPPLCKQANWRTEELSNLARRLGGIKPRGLAPLPTPLTTGQYGHSAAETRGRVVSPAESCIVNFDKPSTAFGTSQIWPEIRLYLSLSLHVSLIKRKRRGIILLPCLFVVCSRDNVCGILSTVAGILQESVNIYDYWCHNYTLGHSRFQPRFWTIPAMICFYLLTCPKAKLFDKRFCSKYCHSWAVWPITGLWPTCFQRKKFSERVSTHVFTTLVSCMNNSDNYVRPLFYFKYLSLVLWSA